MVSKLHEALLKVMDEVKGVEKKGEMKGGAKYTYAQAEDVVAKVRPAMIRYGLTMLPVAADVVVAEQYKTSSGTNMNRAVIRRTWLITHAESGESTQLVTFGEGSDSGDKSFNKAMTGAGKYARREALQLEFGEDDPDKTPSSGMERAGEDEAPKAPAKKARESVYETAKGLVGKNTTFKDAANIAGLILTRCNEGKIKKNDAIELIRLSIPECLSLAKDFAHAAQVQTLVQDAITDGLLDGPFAGRFTEEAENLATSYSEGS